MATPNIVPRADSEGQLGTSSKYWGAAYIDFVYVGAGKIGRDADNLIDFSSDNLIYFRIGAGNEFLMANNMFGPAASDGAALGNGTYKWSDLFLASGAAINFDNGNVLLTHGNNRLTFANSDELAFGNGDDLRIYHNGTNSNIENFDGTLQIIQTVDDEDIVFRCDDGSGGTTAYLTLDGGQTRIEFAKPTQHADNAIANFGSSSDMQIYHNGTDSYILNGTGDLEIINNTDDGDIIFKSDDGSGGVTPYLTLDGGDGIINIAKNTRFLDNVIAKFGTGGDLQIKHNATASSIESYTGDLTILSTSQDNDIVFKGDDGQANTSVATYFYLDGSSATHDGSATTALYTNWPDKSRISLGTSHDIYMYHDGSNTWFENQTGDLTFRNSANDKDIVFQSDDGSGGVATYFFMDGGFSQPYTRFPDNSVLGLGSAIDMRIYHDGSNSYIDHTGTGHLYIRNTTDDADIIFQSDDGSGGVETYFFLDGSAGGANPRTIFPDNSRLCVGSGEDLNFSHDATDSYIQNETGDFYIKQRADDKDIIFQSDDGSGGTTEYFRLDGSNAGFTTFPDSTHLAVGTDRDFRISHDGTDTNLWGVTGDIILTNFADDKDIIFKSDDGSGGVTAYLTLDGSAGYTKASKHIQMADGNAFYVGTNNDMAIFHDGSNSFVRNDTGNLSILNNTDDGDIIFQSDDGSGGVATYFSLDGGNEIVKFNKNIQLVDNVVLNLGSSNDLQLKHDGSNSYVQNTVGDLYIQNGADDKDVILRSDDGSGGQTAYLTLDGSAVRTISSQHISMNDGKALYVGDGLDAGFYHSGGHNFLETNSGNLTIVQNTDDGDIIFKSDDGSGGVAEYFRLDGGAVETYFSKTIL